MKRERFGGVSDAIARVAAQRDVVVGVLLITPTGVLNDLSAVVQ